MNYSPKVGIIINTTKLFLANLYVQIYIFMHTNKYYMLIIRYIF